MSIRVGIGGWTYAPWRGTFYPKGLTQARELEHASRRLTAIEINGTFYRTQSPASFRKWAEETPDDFVFALKGHRFVTNRKVLAEAGPSVETFLGSGVTELGGKLGPINWQLAATKRFDPADIEAFLKLLPPERDGIRLRHALEVRHESFVTPEFVALARRYGVAIVFADSDEHPAIPDPSADFVYARLQRCREAEEAGYPAAELDAWAARARDWEAGGLPADLTAVAPSPETRTARDVFAFFIAGDKVRAPAAAEALIRRV
ncbi:DUF72 domain-containing protein [Enterovirga rhinocerotis]|uniref:Uncharacterized protein YecE (DUF72 family) n=1 Tax=Enterovirga rhinocerotis TaxID=1339210 RepID=A0A4R7BJ92_9HYPH|nr:DUF72 domain-containing protein [Enterovirga rhinocerotis]TDR84532.1 uncharacterized protein YecE (DUF72 family) [Enterovirga rhinocerotis]